MKPTLFTVPQFCEQNPAFTPGGVRWAIFHEKTNGLAESGAIIRQRSTGKRGRILIHGERYLKWVMGEDSPQHSTAA